MGYYTDFELNYSSNERDKVQERLEEISNGYTGNDSGVKWYNHEEDMKQLSREFPDILFELCGEGEESGDIWEKYFKNGKMQCCKAVLTFEPFDEAKLK